eukprot:CAMPEP_0202486572 /NCGR_PEP_ID=MMETSP1361-20130828/5107_1 /ASSEMBLY_ACC=CAM_ASM_000849 /TAXON_ID=210615 /ORGANISM="Staurosira complex sp., Strain CCMP2646" /LENGTH=276 /DNA_ID=CAMNT_0049115755 /DNA_START=374 /DNA_END=1205 /DNA_ORIENTATION=+
MTWFHVHFQRVLLPILLCALCGGNNTSLNIYDKARRRQSFTIPRGGDLELLDEISETIQDSVMDVTIGPWIQKHSILIVKTVVSCFFVAQILAFCGVIGDKGEDLLAFVEDNRSGISKTLYTIISVIRKRLEQMLIAFANLPDRAQFVTCVSIGASVFPLTIKTVALTSLVTLAGFVLAEALHYVGMLGDFGNAITEFLSESETMVKSLQRWIHRQRKIMRKQFQLEELLKTVYKSLGKDRVFWAGLGVGAIASVVLDDKKTSQGLDENAVKKLNL